MAPAPTGEVWSAPSLLVGRARERVLLQHLLRRAGEGAAAIPVISGPAGVGKTTLVRWILAEAHRMPATVLNVSGGGGVIPYGAVRRLLRPLAPVAGARFSALGLAGEEPVDEAHISAEVSSFVVGLARRTLVVLAVDDVQGVDPPSQRVLEELVASVDDAASQGPVRCMAVLATRDPGVDEQVVPRILRLDSARSVPLESLDEHDVHELLLGAGVRPNPRMVAAVLAETGGLPLLVEAAAEQLAAEATDTGAAARTPRVRNVTEALRPRFEKVDRATLRLLTVATVLVEPWSAEALAGTAGAPVPDVDEAMEAAANARLVSRATGGWRFDHPVVRTELRDAMAAPQRQRLHARAAIRLLATGEVTPEALLQAADHLAAAGPSADRAEVADICWRAGEVAARSNAWELVSRLRSAATEASEDALPARSQAERALAAARAAYMASDPAECERHLGHVDALASAAGAAEEGALRLRSACLLVEMRLAETALRPGRRPGVDELQAALDRHGVDSPEAAEAAGVLAEALFVSGESDHALALIERIRGSSDLEGCAPALCRLEFSEGLHRLNGLELDEARACFLRSAEAARSYGASLMEIAAGSRSGLTSILRGDLREAEQDLDAVQTRAEREHQWGEAGYAAAQRAHIRALAGGQVDDLLDRALRLHRRNGFTYSAIMLAPAEAAVSARTGRADRLGTLPPGTYRPSVMGALMAAEAADEDSARGAVASARWRTGFHGPPDLATMTIPVALVELGDLLGDPALVRMGEPALVQLWEAGVRVTMGWPSLVSRLLATAARWDERLADAHRHLDEAGALVDREDLPLEAARLDMERAQVLLASGDQGAGSATLAAALRRFDALHAPAWERRVDALAERQRLPRFVALSQRSRERTVLTTDVVSSTATTARLGDALYLEQLRVHDRLVRQRLAEFGGAELKHTGDGINAAFADAAAAVRCAVAFQRDLAAWAENEPEMALHVRCGVAYGRLTPLGGELHGLVQAEAARVCAHAGPGEVLITAAARRAAGDIELSIEHIGAVDLRGFPAPVELHRVSMTP